MSIAKLVLEQKELIVEKFLFNRELGIDTHVLLTKEHVLEYSKIKCSVELVISPDKRYFLHYIDGDLIYINGFHSKKLNRFMNKKFP